MVDGGRYGANNTGVVAAQRHRQAAQKAKCPVLREAVPTRHLVVHVKVRPDQLANVAHIGLRYPLVDRFRRVIVEPADDQLQIGAVKGVAAVEGDRLWAVRAVHAGRYRVGGDVQGGGGFWKDEYTGN